MSGSEENKLGKSNVLMDYGLAMFAAFLGNHEKKYLKNNNTSIHAFDFSARVSKGIETSAKNRNLKTTILF